MLYMLRNVQGGMFSKILILLLLIMYALRKLALQKGPILYKHQESALCNIKKYNLQLIR